jgi:glycosyltransferase involved in cell wall biosynthesis
MRPVKLGPNRTERWPSRGARAEPLDAVADGPSIGIEQQDQRRVRRVQPLVACGTEAAILLELDEPDAREAATDEILASVRRGIVDDDHLPIALDDRGEGPLEVGARVVGDDDDGEFTHGRDSSEPNAGAARTGPDGPDSMRLLVVVPYPPRLDARHGGKALAQLLMRLAERHRVALVHLRRPREEPVDKVLEERCDLVEAITVPDPSDPSGRWKRAVRLTHGLLTGRPMQVAQFSSRAYAERLREVAEHWRPNVIQVELEAMAQYLPVLEHSPGQRILVLDEPAARTAEEVSRTARGLDRIVRLLDRRAWRRFELRIAGRADIVVVLTESDREAAITVAGGRPVYTIPLKADLPPGTLDALGTSPPSVVFVGGFGHPPNVEAARRLALRIFPFVLERRPESLLYLVGDQPPAEVRALARDGVVVTGGVADVESYLNRAAVVAAPLRIGGGMRLKVLEALGAGKALVATPRAVEGLAICDGEHAVVADSDAAFAEALLRLLDNPDERRRLGANARIWAERHLDPALAVAAYERLYREMLSQRER